MSNGSNSSLPRAAETFDVVLVWRLDRWGRSVADLVSTLQELTELGVGFVSLTEALDLTTPAGRAMAGLLAVFAAFEHDICASACVPDSIMPAAWASASDVRRYALSLQPRRGGVGGDGISKSEIARQLGIGRTSVRRLLARKRS